MENENLFSKVEEPPMKVGEMEEDMEETKWAWGRNGRLDQAGRGKEAQRQEGNTQGYSNLSTAAES